MEVGEITNDHEKKINLINRLRDNAKEIFKKVEQNEKERENMKGELGDMEDVQSPLQKDKRESKGEKTRKENSPDLKEDTGFHTNRANQELNRMKEKKKKRKQTVRHLQGSRTLWWNFRTLRYREDLQSYQRPNQVTKKAAVGFGSPSGCQKTAKMKPCKL